MKLLRTIIWLMLFAAVGAGGFQLWKRHEASRANLIAEKQKQNSVSNAPTISVVHAKVADFVETAMVSGSLVAREEALVSPEIEGFRVLELFADEGSEVKKGDVLARLVAEQFDAQVAQSDANLAAADASIARAKSQIIEAEARAKEAASQLERARPLLKSRYLSEAAFEQRESAAQTTEAQVAAAKNSLTSAEAQKAQVQAQRRELDWRRGNTEVRTPVGGVVSSRNARVGGLASAAGQPMFRIITDAEIELDAEIVETEMPKIKAGQKARITVPGSGEVQGTVRLVSPEIDATTRLGRARIFIGRNPSLRIGAFARGVIETGASRGIAVPPSSVMFDPAGAYVQVVVGDKISRRDVQTGIVSNGRVEIREGLSENDVVVARAGTFLRDGDIIHPVISGTE